MGDVLTSSGIEDLKKNNAKMMQKHIEDTIKVLFVDDDEVTRIAFKRMVADEKLAYHCTLADSVEAAKRFLQNSRFDIVISDYRLGDGTVFNLFDDLGEASFIVITGVGNEDMAVKAMKQGALAYVIKDDKQQYLNLLPVTVHKVLHQKRTEKRVNELERELNSLNSVFGPRQSAVTEESFGLGTIALSHQKLASEYASIMDQALEQQAFKVEGNISERLETLAEKLGYLLAGPRDVIELHTIALQNKVRDAGSEKAKAYTHEARFLVLELMGNLVAYYRTYSRM